MTSHPGEEEQISSHLRKVLNTHGHGFHYAVVRRGEELSDEKKIPWILDATEIPVIAGETATHIDFVLHTRSDRIYLVGECKRADPAKARWCFARAPYTWHNASEQELIFDLLLMRPNRTHNTYPVYGSMSQGSYHLGFELRTGKPGDGAGGTGRAIEDAIAQVLRATSGFINLLTGTLEYPSENNRAIKFIPAIFTTADIWATDADLGAADLATGDLSAEQVKARKVEWLWFTHNRSSYLRPYPPYEGQRNNLSRLLRHEYARSIAVVGVDGIDDFLQTDLEEWLE